MEKIIIKAFNVNLQVDDDHVVSLDKNGELVFTGSDGSFFKMPGGLSAEELSEKLEEYKKVNEGKVFVKEKDLKEKEEKNQKTLEEVLKIGEVVEVEEE